MVAVVGRPERLVRGKHAEGVQRRPVSVVPYERRGLPHDPLAPCLPYEHVVSGDQSPVGEPSDPPSRARRRDRRNEFSLGREEGRSPRTGVEHE